MIICRNMCRNFSESHRKFESLYITGDCCNEGTDCRFVLNSKEIERFFVAMHMKISLRAASAYLLYCRDVGRVSP